MDAFKDMKEPDTEPQTVTVSEAIDERLWEKGELWHSPFVGDRRISHIDERMWAHDHEQHDPAGIKGRSWSMHGGQELRFYPDT